MERQVRENLGLVTAALTVVSLALVFAAAGRVVPQAAIPQAPDVVFDLIPHVNAVVSLAAIATITLGVREIRRSNVVRHQRLMTASFALFATFLVLYLYKVAAVGTAGPQGAPAWVETYVYLPVLGIHMLLAMIAIPLVYYALLLASVTPLHELAETRHPQVGRAAASLWLISFVLGEVVYVLLYWLY